MIPWVLGVSIGVLVGCVVTALSSRLIIRRAVVRARAAERRARAAEHMAEIGSMTGGLAHEIKNPLSTIGLNAQLLGESLDELDIPAPERDRLKRRISALRHETERLKGILSDFLEFAGELHLDRRRTDLNEAVSELSDFFHPQAAAQGVRLRIELDPQPLSASLDVPYVKQAVLNLMLNALQAITSPEARGDDTEARSPELILRTERGSDSAGADTVVLHVINTGPGIEPERQAKIFQPYFTTRSGGTGLGLPTTRRIVEAHGGRIELHSEPGRGTDFTLVFPAALPTPDGPARGA